MRHRRFAAWCLLLCLLLPMFAHAADVQATLDRSSVPLGETVTLNLRIQGDVSTVAMPDFSALNSDFDVLGTSQNSSLSVVNGAATSELVLGVMLRPRHAGLLAIPAMDIAGSRTAPLQVNVTSAAATPGNSVATNRDIFMESQVEPDHGYVGQQLSYVVRLFFATSLSSGSLDAPQVSGLQVSRNGDDTNSVVDRGGRQYHVLERRFALVPQRAGRIDIPALNFQGIAIDPNDPDSFFGARKPVSARAPPVSITIRAAPADWGSTAWLPARAMTLTLDGLPGAKDAVRVGQPLNLTMTLQATGLSADALPPLSLPPLDGATVYPDKPATTSRNDGSLVVGQRQQAFAIVPERAGTLSIPATSVKWWDVLNDRMAVAQIPAHQLVVLPAVGAADVHTSIPAAASASGPAAASTVAAAAAPTSGADIPWRWLALGSVGLWLLSMLGWLLWRNRRRRQPQTSTAAVSQPSTARAGKQAFLRAADGSDTAAQARTLLAWARLERPAVLHLGDLSTKLADEQQRAAIAGLQQRQYAAGVTAANDVALGAAFQRGFIWKTDGKDEENGELPPLYPFKVR